MSFNPLHLDEGEDLDTKVDEALTIFKRVIGNSTGQRSEEILRQALYALVAMPDATLLDIERLLDRTDATFRIEVIRSTHDEGVRHFWHNANLLMRRSRTCRSSLASGDSSVRKRSDVDWNPHQTLNLNHLLAAEGVHHLKQRFEILARFFGEPLFAQ